MKLWLLQNGQFLWASASLYVASTHIYASRTEIGCISGGGTVSEQIPSQWISFKVEKTELRKRQKAAWIQYEYNPDGESLKPPPLIRAFSVTANPLKEGCVLEEGFLFFPSSFPLPKVPVLWHSIQSLLAIILCTFPAYFLSFSLKLYAPEILLLWDVSCHGQPLLLSIMSMIPLYATPPLSGEFLLWPLRFKSSITLFRKFLQDFQDWIKFFSGHP